MSDKNQTVSNKDEKITKEGETKQAFDIQRLYTKDTSFESPNAPDIFREQWKPEVKLDINTKSNKLEEKVFEVVLTVTATAEMDKKNVFLAEVHQAGIFSIDGFKEEQMGQMLGSFCPNILYPYAHEAISDLVSRGGFPPLYLAPINFDALYAQHSKAKAEETIK